MKFDKPHVNKVFEATNDIFTLFIEQGLRLLKPNWYQSFIIPIFWQTGDNYVQTRKFIAKNAMIELGIVLPYNVFADAYVDTGIYIFKKTITNNYQSMVYEFDPKTKIEKNIFKNIEFKQMHCSKWQNAKLSKIVFNETNDLKADVHLKELLNDLVKQASESEWLEFKLNYHSPEQIGKGLSALSNGACLHNQPYGYLVFGVEDKTHRIVGTTFKPKVQKKGGEDLEHWLATRLNPRIDFTVETFEYDTHKEIVIYVIPAAQARPIEFLHHAYIRVGSLTRKIGEFPEKAAKIWRKETKAFEKQIALVSVTPQDVIQLLSTQTYFDLLKQPYPTQQANVISKFVQEGLILPNKGNYDITKLAALLFAKNLNNFESLARKVIRAIVYKSKSKVATEREHIDVKGYALAFATIVEWVNSQLPANEEIGKVLRDDTRMYPEIAIRELIANALIHHGMKS